MEIATGRVTDNAGNHYGITLMDGPDAGRRWYMLRCHGPLQPGTTLRVAYDPADQFCQPAASGAAPTPPAATDRHAQSIDAHNRAVLALGLHLAAAVDRGEPLDGAVISDLLAEIDTWGTLPDEVHDRLVGAE